MKPLAAARLFDEREDWLARGRGAVIAALLDRFRPPVGDVLDVGAGAGQYVPMLARYGPVDMIEVNEDAHALLAGQALARDQFHTGIPELHLHRRYGLIGAFEVIEHIRDDRAALAWIDEHLVDCGILLITVPAYQWMFSDHDVANRHFRRYSRRRLTAIIPSGLTVLDCGYFNTLLFPAALAARASWLIKSRLLRRETLIGTDKQSAKVPAIVDRWFGRILAWEASAIRAGMQLPWGLSVYCVARKNCAPHAVGEPSLTPL
jgi:SAM-dependent methyltransferase